MKSLPLNRRKLITRALGFGAIGLLPGCDFDHPNHPDLTDRVLSAMSRWNDEAQAALFDRHTLAPTFPASAITRPARFNAFYDISQAPQVNPATSQLAIANTLAIAAPMPLDTPVTSARLSKRSI